jgi:hypothetical protein
MVTPAAKTKATDAGRVLNPPASVVAPVQDSNTPSAPTLIQRQVALAGGTRPQTPPEQLSPLLGQGGSRGNPQVLGQLQRGYGNQYVGRVIQAKLSVSQPGDRYEQEADRVADWVMRMAAPQAVTTTAPPTIQRLPVLCEDCEGRLQRQPLPNEKKEEEDEKKMLRKATPGGAPRVSAGMEGRLNSRLQGGQPLAPTTRAFFEPRFGRDFSQVRVHQDAGLAKGLNAQAFTVGNHVVFGAGRYQPETPVGKRLLAHELTHVVQQGSIADFTKKAQRKANLWIQRQELENSDFSFDEGSFSKSSFEQSGTEQSSNDTPFGAPLENQNTALLMAVYSKSLLPLAENIARETLPELQEEKLQQTISGTPTYELVKKKNKALKEIRDRIKHAEYWRSIGGVEAWSNMEEDIIQKIPKLQSEVDRLNPLIESNLRELGVETEEELLRLVEKDFPETWINRAKKITLLILIPNKQYFEKEKERINNDPTHGYIEQLRDKDRQLANIVLTQEKLSEQRYDILFGGDADKLTYNEKRWELLNNPEDFSTDEDNPIQVIQELDDDFLVNYNKLKSQLEKKLNQLGEKCPILLADRYQPGIFLDLDSEEIKVWATAWLDEKLEDIKDTWVNIAAYETIRVWDLNLVPELTFQSLGVDRESTLGKAVENYIQDEKSDEEALKTARAVIEAIVSIGAAIVGGPLLGLIAGVCFGLKDLLQSVQRYKAESSAENIGVGNLLSDISKNDPDAFSIALDLLSLGLEFAELDGVIKVFKASKYLRARDFDNLSKELIDQGGVEKEMTETAIKKAKRKLTSATGEFIDPDPSLIASSIDEIEGNIHRVVPSKNPGDLYELDVNGKHWRMRALDHTWCFNPCINLDEKTKKSLLSAVEASLIAARNTDELLLRLDSKLLNKILGNDYILDAFQSSPELLNLVDKHGDIVVKILYKVLDEGCSHKELIATTKAVADALTVYDKYLYKKIEGAESLVEDLAAGGTTFLGAAGEIHATKILLEEGILAEELIIPSLKKGRKTADILVKGKEVIDVKNLSISEYLEEHLESLPKKFINQIKKRMVEFPRYKKFRLMIAELDLLEDKKGFIDKMYETFEKEIKEGLGRKDLELNVVELPTRSTR